MIHNKTNSILHRLAVILTVTAASYGLPAAHAARSGAGKSPSGANVTALPAAPVARAAALH